ncbi:MAG: substrate-binding domain-containing protein [Gammaproteobacteria bacterium]
MTLALGADVEAIAATGKLIAQNWASRLPNNSTPYTSTIVFLVKKGNPKGIKDWGDLIKPGISVITANPKNLRRSTLELPRGVGLGPQAAGRDGRERPRSSCASSIKTCRFSTSGARGSTVTFAQRGLGDVLLAWENEAFLALRSSATTSSRSSCRR